MNTILDNLKIRKVNHFEREKALVGMIGRLEGGMAFIASSLDSGGVDVDEASMSIKMMLKQSEDEFNNFING